jgi:uncharacterized membrane protein YdfJ with MMPL/SSD domain
MSMTRAPSVKPLTAAPVSSLGRLGSWSYRHRRLVTVAWVAILVVISLGGRLAGSAFKDNLNGGTSTPSQQAASFLQRSFPGQAGDVAQVFLVSRIREEWRAGPAGSPTADSDAVANALARTGRIITSAAAIMICVFAAFVLGDLRVLRVIGLGMAVAVLLDATLVRMVATPAALQLTGRANWWFPRWLDRIMPGFLTEVLATRKGSS